MSRGFGAVKERTFELIETGEYVLTLNDLEFEADGPYGDSMKWEWMVAPREDPTNYICRQDGNERTIRTWTGADIELGSQQHEWCQVLTGRTLEKGDEPPEIDDLRGKRMIAYLTHQAPKKGPNAGKLREKIVAGSAKRFAGPHKTVARPMETAAQPAETTAEAPAQDDNADRAVLIDDIKKQVRKAAILDIEAAELWAAINLDEMSTQDLRDGLQTIKEAIAAA